MDLRAILVTCIIGLVVGVIAKLLMPGRDPGGCIITMLLGIAGAWLGTFVGRATFGGEGYTARWIMSIAGAMILLLIYRIIFGKRA